jgi:hypothetical protein
VPLLRECAFLRRLKNALALPLAARHVIVTGHVDVFAHRLSPRERTSQVGCHAAQCSFITRALRRSGWMGTDLPDKYYGAGRSSYE